jgi:guanylate kinase
MIILVGPTGSGKTSTLKALCEINGMVPLYTFTTRPPRGDDDFGTYCVLPEQFESMLEHNEFISHASFDATFGKVSYGIKKMSNGDNIRNVVVVGTYEYMKDLLQYGYDNDGAPFIVYFHMSDEDIISKYEETIGRADARADAIARLERDRKKNNELETMAHMTIKNPGYKDTPKKIARDIITAYQKFTQGKRWCD